MLLLKLYYAYVIKDWCLYDRVFEQMRKDGYFREV
jgi:hypothetical protein